MFLYPVVSNLYAAAVGREAGDGGEIDRSGSVLILIPEKFPGTTKLSSGH